MSYSDEWIGYFLAQREQPDLGRAYPELMAEYHYLHGWIGKVHLSQDREAMAKLKLVVKEVRKLKRRVERRKLREERAPWYPVI